MLCREGGGARPRPTWEPFRCSLSLPGIKNPNCRNDNECKVGSSYKRKRTNLFLEFGTENWQEEFSEVVTTGKIIELSIITVARPQTTDIQQGSTSAKTTIIKTTVDNGEQQQQKHRQKSFKKQQSRTSVVRIGK